MYFIAINVFKNIDFSSQQSVFAVLVFVQISYGHRLDDAPPEEVKSSSEIRYYYPDQSGNYYERKPDPPEKDDDDSKEEDTPRFVKEDLYKPHKDPYVSKDDELDEASKYIPHSKRYSKFLGPHKSPISDSKFSHLQDDKEETKKDETPRYGFTRYKDESDDYEHHEKQVEEDFGAKNPSPYTHEPKHTTHSYENADEYKHYEHDDEDSKSYPEHKDHQDHHSYDSSAHEHSHPYDRDDHEEHISHHGPERSKYQHWSDKHAESFPPLETDKVIEEVHKVKSHRIHIEPETNVKPWHEEKASYVPYEEEHGKEHSSHHKSPHHVNDEKSYHSEHHHPTSDSESKYPFLKHYPHINKFQKENYFKSFINYKPNLNFGGHHYGWMYRPRGDFYKELRKDLDIKMRLLKEHENKLAELQKGHLEKYRALFDPPHAKKYFHKELPKFEIPNVDHKLYSHSEDHHEKYGHPHAPPKHDLNHDVKYEHSHPPPTHSSHYEDKYEHHHPPPPPPKHSSHYEESYDPPHAPPKHSSQYDDYHKEPEYVSHKSEHHSHYEPEHEEPRHYSNAPRPYKDEYTP